MGVKITKSKKFRGSYYVNGKAVELDDNNNMIAVPSLESNELEIFKLYLKCNPMQAK